MDNSAYIYYGAKAKATDIALFMDHIVSTNLKAPNNNKKTYPICIWGKHGIGKTALVESFAQDNNYQFAYLAPAQFEEMGDLIGMPYIKDGQTVFAPPEWVPKNDGPGILLIDDVNRADDRILRGIMQLLQNNELKSWRLPKGWQIILTANPDGGNYSVTPMDEAMITRMHHITMQFDLDEWVNWASDHKVDKRGINFVIKNPSIFEGSRTTPRTLVQFFESIQLIPDLKKEKQLILHLAEATLDPITAMTFIEFIEQNLDKIPEINTIINTNYFEKEVYKPLFEILNQEVFRKDTFSRITESLLTALEDSPRLNETQLNNIAMFIKLDFLPKDVRFNLIRSIAISKDTQLTSLVADPAIGKYLLA